MLTEAGERWVQERRLEWVAGAPRREHPYELAEHYIRAFIAEVERRISPTARDYDVYDVELARHFIKLKRELLGGDNATAEK